MNVKIGICKDPVNKLTKSPSFSITRACTFKDYNGVSDRAPSIQLAGNYTDFQDFNYCQIEGYGYYYITDRVSLRNGITELKLSLDPLMTYQKEIQNSTGIIERSEAFYNYYMEDPFINLLSYMSIDCKPETFGITGDVHNIAVIVGE